MIDDEEPVDAAELETRVDDQGRRYGVLKPRVPLDKAVAYFAFDREAQEEAERKRYLNQMGALGVLEARAKADKLKSGVSSAQYEYALFISENPWAVANHQLAPKRWPWAMVAFAAVLVLAVVAAAIARPTLAPPVAQSAPPLAAEVPNEPPRAEQGRAGRAAARDIKPLANVY